MIEKPFYQSCENNKKPILKVLTKYLSKGDHVLEIGSGSGQHSVFFSNHLDYIEWFCSDRLENHAGIHLWHEENPAKNLHAPIELDVAKFEDWPNRKFDAVFTSNTVHIMSWENDILMFQGISRVLSKGGLLLIYGPFKMEGEFTSESNKKFENWLKQQGAHMGIRDIEAVNLLAKENQMNFFGQIPMPANNFILIWQKD